MLFSVLKCEKENNWNTNKSTVQVQFALLRFRKFQLNKLNFIWTKMIFITEIT